MGVRYLTETPPSKATGLLKRVNGQIKRDFGPIGGPWSVLSVRPELLAGGWALCREATICGELERAAKESLAVSVSNLNDCPFCEEAHSMFADAAGDSEAAATMRQDSSVAPAGPVGDLARWAKAVGPDGRGEGSLAELTPGQRAEALGTYLCYQWVNRLVNVFHDERVLPVPRTPLDGVFRSVATRVLMRPAGKKVEPGRSLQLLPDSELPHSQAWAESSPTIAGAVARLACVCEGAGEAVLSPDTRIALTDAVEAWDGEAPGFGNQWLEAPLEGVEDGEVPTAGLALATAIASWKVDQGMVEGARTATGDDERPLGAVAWGGWVAASTFTARAARVG